jgi:hypothetical protein
VFFDENPPSAGVFSRYFAALDFATKPLDCQVEEVGGFEDVDDVHGGSKWRAPPAPVEDKTEVP